MQPRFGNYVERGATRAYVRAWSEVASPAGSRRTVDRWQAAGLLDFLPTEPTKPACCPYSAAWIDVASSTAGLEHVRGLQAAWRVTSGSARAAIARTYRWPHHGAPDFDVSCPEPVRELFIVPPPTQWSPGRSG